MKNILENLELKLLQTRRENAEKLDEIETEFKKEFGSFFDSVLENDNLGFKRYVSVNFQLEKLDNSLGNSLDILKSSVKKALEIYSISQEKKDLFLENILLLEKSKEKINDLFIEKTDLHKDKNFPIIESLEKYGNLNKQDLLKITLKYKETHNFLDSILVLESNKIELIKSNYFELNNTKSEERIENFEADFKEEINNSKNIQIYPKIIKFIGKNYFRLKLKNKVETKKDRLKRLFKIAFLKLYRLKFSGIEINSIINKIDSLDDLDSMINLLFKFFEQLKQNPNLSKDYIVIDEIDIIEEIDTEAEENKEKILFLEKNIIKSSEILEKTDKYLNENDLEELLGENVDLVGKNFIKRNEDNINVGIYDKRNEDNINEEVESEKELKEVDLEEYYENLKHEYEDLEKKKMKLFLEGKYDKLDFINDSLIDFLIKLEKLEKIIDN